MNEAEKMMAKRMFDDPPRAERSSAWPTFQQVKTLQFFSHWRDFATFDEPKVEEILFFGKE